MTTLSWSKLRPGRLGAQSSAAITTGLTTLSVILVVVAFGAGADATVGGLLKSLVVISVVPIVVAFAQSLVVLTGGLDLSLPWIMTMGGVFLTGLYSSTGSGLLAVGLVLLAGLAAGLLNGVGVALLKVPAVVMTLGMNTVVQGIVLMQVGGAPKGQAPPLLIRLMNRSDVLGIPNSLWLTVLVLLIGTAVYTRTSFGRMVYAVGGSERAAVIAGLPTKTITVAVYGVSGLTAALAGVLLTGYTERSFLGMGDQYLLPSIAAVVIGGASVLGGRGGYPQTAAGVVFLSATTIAIGGRTSDAGRAVIFGLIILASAALFNRQSSRG